MKFKIGAGIVIAVLMILVLNLSCNTHPTYKVENQPCDQNQGIIDDSIESVRIFLETSLSMKGYVNRPNVTDSGYIIQTAVPILITDCRVNLCQPELWTISNAPERYFQSEEEFIRNLRDGNLMRSGNTQIHYIFQHIIESNNTNEISFLISDCIPDLGEGHTVSELNFITTTIYDVLRSNQDISATVFQYYSEFNGDSYYDSRGWEQPFEGRNITMHERPLYIWIFGRSDLIDEALKNQLLSNRIVNFQNCYFYRDNPCFEIPFTILSSPVNGKVAIRKSGDEITIVKISPTMPVSFTIGLNLNNVPAYINKTEYLSKNLRFDKNHLNDDNEIKVYDLSSLKEVAKDFVKIAPAIASKSLTHFIHVTLRNLNPKNDVEFSLVLNNNEPAWIEDAYIQNDLNVAAVNLERKTFAYSKISEAFNLRFQSGGLPNNLFEIKFKLTSN